MSRNDSRFGLGDRVPESSRGSSNNAANERPNDYRRGAHVRRFYWSGVDKARARRFKATGGRKFTVGRIANPSYNRVWALTRVAAPASDLGASPCGRRPSHP